MKLRLLLIGKTRRPELRALFDDYLRRIGHSCAIEAAEVRDGEAAMKKLDALKASTVLLLDAAGKSYDSETFSRWLGDAKDRGTREMVFVCADAAGPSAALRARVPRTLSLGAMTYSHELARVMLAEQLYRALALLSGSPYPK